MKLVCKSRRIINIRSLEPTDQEKLYNYYSKIVKERTFILDQGSKITKEGEAEFLNLTLKAEKENKTIYLLAEYNNEIISSCSIEKRDKALHHIADIGVIVAKKYRGEGIGKILMQKVIKEAKKKWKDLKIITLDVFANNKIAQKLYYSLGFQVYGILPKGVYYRHRLVDRISMFKKVR